MRLGVIDVGSNTVHLLVVDAHAGGHRTPDVSHTVESRLAEHLTEAGDISQEGAQTPAGFGADCVEVAESRGATELVVRPWALREGVILRFPDGLGR